MYMKLRYIIITFIIGILIFLATFKKVNEFSYIAIGDEDKFWKVQSIDTMKYSRDLSREKLEDKSFDSIIDDTMKKIAATGATHVSVGTPYDLEFLPILKRWADSARRNNLKIWFRGNWSGWEGWFGYPKISRDKHIIMTKNFILNNPSLFKDGDIFTACPECENGGPGDPRHNGDLYGHRVFLIKEYQMTKSAFEKIGKNVRSNFNSMNGDVAALVMDKATTQALGGIVAVDHYVATPDKLAADIKRLSAASGGKVVLSEFGVPIPDINGEMSEFEQAKWISGALEKLIKTSELEGLNYWVSVGGSTEIWTRRGSPRLAVQTITKFFNPEIISGFIIEESGKPITGALIKGEYASVTSGLNGHFKLPYLKDRSFKLEISAPEYLAKTYAVDPNNDKQVEIFLTKAKESLASRFWQFIKSLFS
ncbi:MAG: hypothetical protein HW401_390 [Parcubacteria group bacterium]|nr:hypothetical protein [Parcubacteria group bacterium]